MTAPRHILGVWNPSYASDAMEATLQLLLGQAAAFRAGRLPEEEVYVWWGKIRSSNRQAPLPHLAQIRALDEELSGDDGPTREIHLYLTDYRSLYVAHVAEVTTDEIRNDATEADHVPAFYAEREYNCDCWFRLFDIRRIVVDDTPAVVQELKQLRNTHYDDRPVSIYGGMVNLPLLVTRPDGMRFFEPDVRARLTDERFWVEFDAERSGIASMERELRDNVVGIDAWLALDPTVRSFAASAEAVFRGHRADPGFDFSGVLIDFAKAFEVQVNLLVRHALSRAPDRERLANVNGRTVDIADGTLWSLGELAHILSGEQEVNSALKRRLVNGEWFTASLPPILRELSEVRNPAAHAVRVAREQATRVRNRVLGIGTESTLARLGSVSVRP